MSSIPTKITISPRALYEMIKDMQVGRNGAYAKGYLYGLPDDPIEVTSAFPAYSVKIEPGLDADPAVREEYIQSVQNFQKAHCEELMRQRFDYEHVGRYTTRNVGQRIHFHDLTRQYEDQKTDPHLFTLVISSTENNLSARAFRVSPAAMEFMKTNSIDDIGYIADQFQYEKFVEELEVSYSSTPLDNALMAAMSSRQNLDSDIFQLRDMSTTPSQMLELYDGLDRITNDVANAVEDKKRLEENREARAKWEAERKEINKRRAKHGQEPYPLSEIDSVIPKLAQAPKREAIDDIYEFKARAAAVKGDLTDEQLKLRALAQIAQPASN